MDTSMKRIVMSDAFRCRNIERLASVDSTNTYLKRRITRSELSPFWPSAVTASSQSEGRGRRGRSWLDTDGALLMSIAFPLTDPDNQLPFISISAAVGALRTVKPYLQNAAIKWPNDIVVTEGNGYKKLCGILSELCYDPHGKAYAVCGVGINVNCRALPEGLLQPATSVFIETGHTAELKSLSESLYDNVANVFDLITVNRITLLEEYSANCITIGKDIIASDLSGSTLEGRAVALDDIGRLIVSSKDGLHTVSAADVSIRDHN